MMTKSKLKFLAGWDVWIARRSTSGFINDFKTLFNQMSGFNLNAIWIWGFLDDKHGGVEAGKELISYARSKEILLCPGIGVYSYSGVWCRGNHQYNLETYLAKYPERTAKMKVTYQDVHPLHSKFVNACPSNEDNRKWMAEGIKWFINTLNPDAVYFETGDYGVCGCDKCVGLSNSVASKIKIQLPIWEEAHKINPGLTIFWSTYVNYDNLSQEDTEMMERIPSYVYTIWTVTRDFYYDKIETRNPLPEGKHLALAHVGGSTHFELPYNSLYPRYSLRLFQPQVNGLRILAEACKKERWDGILIPMSGLADRTDNELNYRIAGKMLEAQDFDSLAVEEIENMFGKGVGTKLLDIFLKIEKLAKTLKKYFFWFRSFYNVPATQMGYTFTKELPAKSESIAIINLQNISAQLNEIAKEVQKCKLEMSVNGKGKICQVEDWVSEQVLLTTHVYPKFIGIQSKRELSDEYINDLEKQVLSDPALKPIKIATMRM
ncbi:MAG: hypothetical protein WC955_02160 [Elusimicrobiota bacterium]